MARNVRLPSFLGLSEAPIMAMLVGLKIALSASTFQEWTMSFALMGTEPSIPKKLLVNSKNMLITYLKEAVRSLSWQ